MVSKKVKKIRNFKKKNAESLNRTKIGLGKTNTCRGKRGVNISFIGKSEEIYEIPLRVTNNYSSL
ncbi:MAG: hypothetical protein KGD59_15695 [Candidatus Heimdallarchaeota archaeon]|nr:hypothetical protein [Candidatus Heimdallarchaeota archaeon]MBY8995993.1 hypothetical protein [Candidatus Heimdallarchaeota archaeon]